MNWFATLALMQAAPGQTQPMWVSFAPLILIFALFYFLILGPSRKRQRKLQETIEALKKGDRIITTGGIYGEIVATESDTALIKVSDNVRVRVAKSAIAGLQGDEEAGP